MKKEVLNITIEFGCGAELLFGNKKTHQVILSAKENSSWSIRQLLPWMKDNLIQEREELFFQGESVRPGILVLVNDTDWELLGGLDYEMNEGDKVLFISTLHGG